MAIGGIGNSYGINSNYYSYQSSINNLKLQKIMNGFSNTGKVGAVSNVKNLSSSLSDSLSFVKKYDTQMTDLLNSANALRDSNTSGVMNKLTVNSSDESVASASTDMYRLRKEQSFDLDVKQLASGQQNQSSGVASNQLASGDLNLTIQTSQGGSYDFSLGSAKPSGGTMTNAEQLKNMAEKINLQGIGVTASVETKDGVSSLKLTSDKTGADAAFEVSGSSAEEMGLNDPVQRAQDAVYTVSENGGAAREVTSSTNKINLADGQITANLKKTGKVNVNIGVDSDDVISATEDLINKYNKVVQTLGSNSDRGSGVINQLSRMVMAPASERSLKLAGISVNDDGTLALDKDKLAESLKKDPKLTKEILGGSNGLANGAYQDAVAGMNRSSSSLMNYDMEMAKAQNMSSSVNFLNMYSKMGSVNMMNLYASGMFFNMMA